MQLRFACLLVLVACGGGSKPAATPVQPDKALSNEAPPPAPSTNPFYARLRDADGAVAALPGYALARKPSAKHCGYVQVVTTRGANVPADDAPLAAVFDLEFPTGLNFDPDKPELQNASKAKLDAFMAKVNEVGSAARKHYEGKLAAGMDMRVGLAAVARLAQASSRMASIFGRAEIPEDIREGELAADKIEAFCDALIAQAEMLQASAEQAITVCVDKSKETGPGWWNQVCVNPTAPKP